MSASDGGSDLASELLRQRICLYLYGELSLRERREVERLRRSDPAFANLFREEEAFLLAISDTGVDSEVDSMLGDCRSDLALAVCAEKVCPVGLTAFGRALGRLGQLVTPLRRRPLVWQPAFAVALLAAGFFAGRSPWADVALPDPPRTIVAEGAMSPDGDTFAAGVETIHLGPGQGQVRIVLEERRVVTGDPGDPAIRAMLFDTARESHAGARLASLEALHRHAADGDVRRILLHSMLEDQNVGVRLRAMEAIRSHAGEPDVRRALLQLLRTEELTGMRIHAIQILRQYPGRDLAGALQELVEREQNPFVVQESESILDGLDASMERF